MNTFNNALPTVSDLQKFAGNSALCASGYVLADEGVWLVVTTYKLGKRIGYDSIYGKNLTGLKAIAERMLKRLGGEEYQIKLSK